MTSLANPAALAEKIADLSESQRAVFISRLPPGTADRVKEILTAYATEQAQEGTALELLPHQRIPDPHMIDRGHVFAGGRGAGKTLALANYGARIAESIPNLRMRVIAPTLSDAVNATALDPQSGILAHSPAATFRPSGVEGARITWPNGSVCYLVGTPTLKEVDRLRALTNIDVDLIEEAAANPRLTEAMAQANLSRRGNRLDHPIWIAATTPRAVPEYRKWLEDPRVSVTRATTLDNPHTPDFYREYAESLKGTHLYEQEILGNVLDDVQGALWTRSNVDKSVITDTAAQQALLATLSKTIVAVDPPSGHGTCGIVVVGVTQAANDPTGRPRIVVLDDFSVASASPSQWGNRVIDAATAYEAPILAERNQGGLMVQSTIEEAASSRGIDFAPVTLAHAKVSKERRAAPVALLWEVSPQRALIAPPEGNLARVAELIDELTSWTPGAFSPDRLDAAVWGALHLMDGGSSATATLQRPSPNTSNRTGRKSLAGSFRSALMGRR